jgi:hypothetical protein
MVLRIRRRHGRVPSSSARGSRSLFRSCLVGVGFSYVGVREIWSSGTRFVVRGGGFGDSSSTRSTGGAGSVAEKARGLPRSTRHNGCASPVTARSSFDSQSLVRRWCDLGLLGRWRLVLLRRPVATAAGFGHGFGGRETSQGLICNFQFFEGLSAVVLGHLYLLEFARDVCVCTAPICVIWYAVIFSKKKKKKRTAGLRTYPRRSTGRTYEQLAPEQKKKKRKTTVRMCDFFVRKSRRGKQ